jgi:hypothetical protein
MECRLIQFVTLTAFYPLVLGVSSHDGTSIRTEFSIHFHPLFKVGCRTLLAGLLLL